MNRRLIVALHDVAPPYEVQIRAQLAALTAAGIDRVVLKVVPNWHGRFPLTEAPSLLDVLRRHQAAGSQIVLHGYQHRLAGSLRGGGLTRVRGELFAREAAEFMSLDRHHAQRATELGLEMLSRAGLGRPDTFCPPGWLITSDATSGVRAAGVRRMVTMFGSTNLVRDRRRWIPAIGYMGVGGAHELGIRSLNALVDSTVPFSSTLTIYFHPGGLTLGRTERRLVERAERMVNAGWRPATYEESDA